MDKGEIGKIASSRIRRTVLYALPVFLIVSCVTINIYFPAAAVEEAADKIVDEVWGEEGAGEGNGGAPEGSLKTGARHAFISIGVKGAHAAEADINVTTPAIRALKGAIRNRAAELKPYLDKGSVGIKNDGLLEIRSSGGLELKEKAKLKRLVSGENKDRKALYAEIAKANNFSPDRVGDIQKLFAKSWQKKAKAGWWIQEEDGKWSRK